MTKIRRIRNGLYEIQPSAAERWDDIEQAELLFAKGLEAEDNGQIDEALSFYRQAFFYNPRADGAMLNIGNIEFERYNFDRATAAYRRASEINPTNVLAHFNLAASLRQQGQSTEAIGCYLQALAYKPNYADDHFNLALEYTDTGEWRKALAHFRLYLRYSIGGDEKVREAARREIVWLQLQELRLVAKPVSPEQVENHVADSQTG